MKRYQICIGLGLLCLILCVGALPATAQDTTNSKPEHEMMFWESVRDSNDIDMYRAYIEAYPNGHFVPIAKIKIQALSKTGPKHTKPVYSTPAPKRGVRLRSKPEKLIERDIRDFLKKYNLNDSKRNPDGRFENVYVDNKDGTITDEATGLIWQKSGSEHKLNKVRAKRYIENLNWHKFAGHANWRLPTLEELMSLMETRPQKPSWFYIDAVFQAPSTYTADRVWSADDKEPTMGSLQGAWIVDFYHGTILQADWEGDTATGFKWEENDENFVKAVCTK